MKDLFWGQTSEYNLNWKAVVLMLEVGSNVKRPSRFGIASFSVEQLQLYCSCGCSYFVNEPFELPFSNSFLHSQNDSLLCGLGNKSKNPVFTMDGVCIGFKRGKGYQVRVLGRVALARRNEPSGS
ncbi:hypothetical protein HPP92_011670 [Vanilla planifolia]|uniref:Uncharacterized protein n=1 Tax=Vanilla planifolia TaxID=51239 RepID=A0A835R656_VANPL|nr:hypothetical protein HPP92_011670 [Vanilla planifolia]